MALNESFIAIMLVITLQRWLPLEQFFVSKPFKKYYTSLLRCASTAILPPIRVFLRERGKHAIKSFQHSPTSQSQKNHISNILQSCLGMDQHLSKTAAMWFGQVLIPPVWQSHNADAAAGHQRCHKTKSRLAKMVARMVAEPGTMEKCKQNVLIVHDHRTNPAKYSETSRTGPPVVRIQITLPNPTNATKQWRTDYSFLMARLHLDEEKHCFVNPLFPKSNPGSTTTTLTKG